MEPYQQRVIEEKQALHDKREKLHEFFHTTTCDKLPEAERDLLIRQASAMAEYEDILASRIDLFQNKEGTQ